MGGGAFTELGPFFPRGDGRSLRINSKSWNKGRLNKLPLVLTLEMTKLWDLVDFQWEYLPQLVHKQISLTNK